MAASPSTQVVVNNRTGQRINLNQAYYTKGTTGAALTPPVISNLGYGGTITSGTPLYYPSGGSMYTNTILWKNASGTIVDYWTFTNTENMTDALALIDAGVLSGTALIVLTTSS